MKIELICCCSVVILGAALAFSLPAPGQDTTDMLSKSLGLVHQVETPADAPPTDAQRIELLTQAIQMAQEAPNHRLKGHRVLAIQAIRTAIAEIRSGDKENKAFGYLQTADTELSTSISLAGEAEEAGRTTNMPPIMNSPDAATSPVPQPAAATPPISVSPSTSDEMTDAIENDDLAKVKALLQTNPELVFSKDKDGDTPLLLAVFFDHKDIAELLVADKADVDVNDNDGNTPLLLAAEGGPVASVSYKDVAEFLLAKGADVDAKDKDGSTALVLAAGGGYKEVAEVLLAHGADVNAKNRYGQTALDSAAMNGHANIAEVLLAHGADIHAKDKCGDTPLHDAAMNGHNDVAVVLLSKGADIHARAKDGETPLDWAAVNGRLEMVKFLLAQGADINAKANNGATPLRLAELHHNYDVATYLRQHGAQEPPGMMITEKFPETGDASTDPASLEAAVRAGDLEKVKALLKADPNSLFDTVGGQYAPLIAAAGADHMDVVELLLANKADVNAKDNFGMTALSHAAQNGYKDMAELLIARKADVNDADESDLTPLFYAALTGRKDIAELLLANGAKVNIRGKAGSPWSNDTPLYIAAYNGRADVAKLLLAHGADANVKGKDGLTPLEIAIKNHDDLAQLPSTDVADLLRPSVPQPPSNPVFALPPGVTTEMEQSFLTKYKTALRKQDTDALLSLVANDSAMDPKAKKDFDDLALFGFAVALSNPDRTYTFGPVTPGEQSKPTQMDGKMYGDYLPAVIALKITFGKPPSGKSSQDQSMAIGDTIIPLCVQNHQLMLMGFKEIPGAVPPPAVDKAANFGIEPNLRKVSDKVSFENRDAFASTNEFLASLKQPGVDILASGEVKFEYYAICRIAPNLCVWAGGDKVGQSNYSFYSKATDSNKQELKGSQKWISLVDVPTDNGQAPNVQGTVFFVSDHYSGPITVETEYSDDKGNKSSSVSRTVDWK